MKELCKMLVLAAVAALTFGETLAAGEGGELRQMRGTFIRLVEQQVNEQGHLGIVIKPLESDDHVTVLVPRENEDLRVAARQLREGQTLAIAFASEGPNNWLRRLEAGRQRERGQQSAGGERRVMPPGEVRRDQVEPGPRPEGQRRPAERNIRRDQGQVQQSPEGRPDRAARSPQEQERLRARPPREGIGPVRGPEPMEAQIRDIVARHAEQMGRAFREILRVRLERMEAELRELRGNTERMERQMQELRAENERLRMQLRNRNEPAVQRQRATRERTELRQQEVKRVEKGQRERNERVEEDQQQQSEQVEEDQERQDPEPARKRAPSPR